MKSTAIWAKAYSRDVDATPQEVWQVLTDTSSWKLWNHGLKSIQMDGNFVTGTWFSMELPDASIIRTQLIDVVPLLRFVDETWIGDNVVKVDHCIQPLHDGRCEVIYAVSFQGPDARDLGEGVSADFPEVLAELAKYVGERIS